ncbi:MAG: hypothetical protein U0232_29800, partial [Thermomicrobiales bacterium]
MTSSHQHPDHPGGHTTHPALPESAHAGHGPATTPQRTAPHQPTTMEHRDHAARGHGHAGHDTGPMAHGNHGGMAHDMSDPAMAAAMERDIRTRFFAALALTIPVVLSSPLGHNLVGVSLPAPIPANWIMLLLTTPVVFWSGWMFVGGAYRALRQRTLDMSVLIATGVLAAYFASLLLMVVGGGEVF